MANELDLQAQVEALRNENAALKAARTPDITLKVSEKKALSIYGLGRFPITLYKSQIDRLFTEDMVARVRQFVSEHESELATKPTKE